MRYLTIITVCIFFSISLPAQDARLLDFNEFRLKKQRTAMYILGGWAVGNIALGSVLRGQHSGVERQFHTMNIGWNVVNLGIATLGFISATKADAAALDLYQTVQEHHGFQKTLLFNAGLDIGYMLGGAYLVERSKNADKNQDQLEGFGKSIILQGGFLFAFDVINYFVFSSYDSQLQPLINQDAMGYIQYGVSLRF